MIVLDYLAYQHRDEWEKLGFTIVDALGTAKLFFGDEKIVTARPITGAEYAMQVFSDVEGVDQSKLAPFAVREQAPGIETVATVEECGVALSKGDSPTMAPPDGSEDARAKHEADDKKADGSDKTLSVDDAFL